MKTVGTALLINLFQTEIINQITAVAVLYV